MTERESFLRAICAEPDEDTPRLAFADWLDEHGEEARAAFIRVQVELAALEAEKREQFNDRIDWRQCTGIAATWCPNCGDCTCRNREESMNDDGCPLHATGSRHCCVDTTSYHIEQLREREAELFDPNWVPDRCGSFEFWFSCFPKNYEPAMGSFGFVFRRGFVSDVCAPTSEFFRLLKVWFRYNPIQSVVLPDLMMPSYGTTSQITGRARIRVNNVPALGHGGEAGATYLPVGMKHLLRAGAFLEPYGDREYDTEAECRADVSQACVRFGRQLVGLEAVANVSELVQKWGR